jgi:phospholipase/carboxylesterase
MLKDYRVAPLKGGRPAHIVIFLHGVGDRGDGGLLSISQLWARDMPDCAFLCPDAPFPFDMAPGDFGGRQWFSLRTHEPADMLAGAKTASPYLDDYIDHVLKEFDLPSSKLALVGFSQGTMMALYTGLRRAQPVACIAGYSGLLVGAESLGTEKKSSPPVLLVHGTADDVVPFQAMIIAEQGLKAADVSVKSLPCPGTGHTIDDNGLAEGLRFIKAAWN